MTDLSDPPAEDEPTRGPGFVLAASLAVLFALAACVLAVLLATGSGDDDELDELRETAGRFGETLVSYSFEDPESHRDAVVAMSTPSFRDEYEKAFEQGLSELITEVEAESRGFVKDVYLSAVDAEQAQAIVVVDIEHDGRAGPNRLYDVYFRLTMIEADGEWLIDDVTDLNFNIGGTGTESTTTTSAPVP